MHGSRRHDIDSRIQVFNRSVARDARQAPVRTSDDNRYGFLGRLDLEDVGRSGFPVFAEAKVADSTSQSSGIGRMLNGVVREEQDQVTEGKPAVPWIFDL